MLSRDDELGWFFENQIPLMRCHYWNPAFQGCSCNKPTCNSAGKHPVDRFGVYDARPYPNAETLGNWNVGLPCGQGFLVVDIDQRETKDGEKLVAEWEAQHGKLPKTWTSWTGGGGRHLIYRAPVGQKGAKFSKYGVEIQGLGSYILLPTSMHKSGSEYEWDCGPEDGPCADAPDWLLKLIEDRRQVKVTSESANGQLDFYDVTDMLDALWSLDPNIDYETWRNIGWALKDAGADFEVFDKWSSFAGERYGGTGPCALVWQSYNPSGGIHAGTLFALAREGGWEPKPPGESLLIKNPEPQPAQTIDPKAPSNTEIPAQFLDEDNPFFQDEPPQPQPAPNPIVQITSSQPGGVVEPLPEPIIPKKADKIPCPPHPPGPIGELAYAIEATAITPLRQFAIASALSVFSGLCAMRYTTPIKGGYLSSYNLIVAGQSDGKEHYLSRAKDIIDKVAPATLIGQPTSSQALQRALFECNVRFLAVDEMLVWLKSKFDKRAAGLERLLVGNFLSYWGTTQSTTEGVFTKDAAERTQAAEKPCISMLGCGTLHAFEELCETKDFVEGGILFRLDCVIFDIEEIGEEKDLIDKASFRLPQHIRRLLEQISGKPESDTYFDPKKQQQDAATKRFRWVDPSEVPWADRIAACHWQNIVNEFRDRSRCYQDHVRQSLWNRCAEKILRTATILAIARNPKRPEVTVGDIDWSHDWHSFVVKRMWAVIGKAKASEEKKLQDAIVDQLMQGRRTLAQSDKYSFLIRQARHRDVKDCLARMSELGAITFNDRKAKNGRQTTDITVIDLTKAIDD